MNAIVLKGSRARAASNEFITAPLHPVSTMGRALTVCRENTSVNVLPNLMENFVK